MYSCISEPEYSEFEIKYVFEIKSVYSDSEVEKVGLDPEQVGVHVENVEMVPE